MVWLYGRGPGTQPRVEPYLQKKWFSYKVGGAGPGSSHLRLRWYDTVGRRRHRARKDCLPILAVDHSYISRQARVLLRINSSTRLSFSYDRFNSIQLHIAISEGPSRTARVVAMQPGATTQEPTNKNLQESYKGPSGSTVTSWPYLWYGRFHRLALVSYKVDRSSHYHHNSRNFLSIISHLPALSKRIVFLPFLLRTKASRLVVGEAY